MSARCSQFMSRVAAPFLVTIGILVSVTTVQAEVGESRGTVDIPATALCAGASGTTVTMVPGGRAGFPKIKVLLATSCQNKIFFLNPATNPATLVKTLTTTVAPATGWAAIALRADRGDILACTAPSTGGTQIYTIDFSPFNTVADGTATLLRNGPATSTCAGIAWDPQSKTIYQSSSGTDVLHFPETGTAASRRSPPGARRVRRRESELRAPAFSSAARLPRPHLLFLSSIRIAGFCRPSRACAAPRGRFRAWQLGVASCSKNALVNGRQAS